MDDRIAVGEVELAVNQRGAGGRPLLLVHGYGGAKEDFDDHLDRLAADGWHVVAPDLRGHGESGQPAGENAYSFELFAGDLLALVDELGWEHFVLLGHSMGGMIAQVLALSAPARVTGLVLMDTSHGPFEEVPPEALELGASIVRDQGLVEYQRTIQELGDPLENPAHARLVQERPGYKEFSEGKLLVCSPEMVASMMVQLGSAADRLGRLPELTMPALVVVGELDGPFLGPSRSMYEALPDARFVVIPSAGHSPQFEAPEHWSQAVDGFLAELADRSRVVTVDDG